MATAPKQDPVLLPTENIENNSRQSSNAGMCDASDDI
jgi:hypothetical protein